VNSITLRHKAEVGSVAFSPDGTKLVSGSWDNTIILWEVYEGKEIHTISGLKGAFNQEGNKLASVHGDATVIVWDLDMDDKIYVSEYSDLYNLVNVTFNLDGTKLASSEKKTIILADVATGEKIQTLSNYPNDVISLAFDPKGTKLLMSDNYNSRLTTIKIPVCL
jgi:eukaryotic-like serine/threonine-protein kinase